MNAPMEESDKIYFKKRYGDDDVAKQVRASLITGFLYVVVGFNISYTGIIVPQLLDERNTSTIETTPAKLSANILGMPLSGLLSGMVVDRFGRMNTMKFYCVPSVIGWLLIAFAKTADVIIVGQFEMGVTYDLYLITATIAVLRIIMSAASLWISKVFNRRTQLIVSGLGMAASLTLSALTTKRMQQNECEMWIPTVSVMAYYVFSCCGVFTVPYVLAAELYPLNVRGLMQSLTVCVACVMNFIALYYYNSTMIFFGGVVGLQYFYSIVSTAFVVYTFVFVPETHKKELNEIEQYFRHHLTYLTV
ncbi:hypothetical protein FQR65_LT18528 [Abscondita terminalis]|nr:hypothetical protein FQR65_LT18528 [Abscondita terminalis]